jgi:hypothetical protein
MTAAQSISSTYHNPTKNKMETNSILRLRHKGKYTIELPYTCFSFMGRHGGSSIHIHLHHRLKLFTLSKYLISIPRSKNKHRLPCKLGFLTIQELQQDDNLSIEQKTETSVQLDCMTFSSERMHHHTP